jgi:hypothetical protein
MMNWKWCGRKELWPTGNFKYYPTFVWKEWPWKPVTMAYPGPPQIWRIATRLTKVFCHIVVFWFITVWSLVGGYQLLIGTCFHHLPLLSCRWKQDVHSKHWYPPVTQHGVNPGDHYMKVRQILKLLSWWVKSVL